MPLETQQQHFLNTASPDNCAKYKEGVSFQCHNLVEDPFRP